MNKGDKTRNAILRAGLTIARAEGLAGVRTTKLAELAGCASTLVFYHFDNLDRVRRAIADYAVEVDDVSVIARLILDDHVAVGALSSTQRGHYLRRAGRIVGDNE